MIYAECRAMTCDQCRCQADDYGTGMQHADAERRTRGDPCDPCDHADAEADDHVTHADAEHEVTHADAECRCRCRVGLI